MNCASNARRGAPVLPIWVSELRPALAAPGDFPFDDVCRLVSIEQLKPTDEQL